MFHITTAVLVIGAFSVLILLFFLYVIAFLMHRKIYALISGLNGVACFLYWLALFLFIDDIYTINGKLNTHLNKYNF